MKYSLGRIMLFLILLILPARAHTQEAVHKSKSLEEMSAEEFREALKKSHSEIESRLGTSNMDVQVDDISKTTSLSERNAYITSAQGRIDRLSYKIDSLQNHYYDNWGYAQRDAAKLRSLQSEARDKLNSIRRADGEGWHVYKNSLESILRQTSDF